MNHKTALATAASVAGVLLAGVTAVGANMGILASTNVGELNSQDPTVVAASAGTVVENREPDVYTIEVGSVTEGFGYSAATSAASAPAPPPPSAPPATAPSAELLAFEVDGVGIVTLARDGTQLTVEDIQASGWDWTVKKEGEEVKIEFLAGDRKIQFEAKVQNGQVVPKVEEQQIKRGDDDDEHEEEHHEDDDDGGEHEEDD